MQGLILGTRDTATTKYMQQNDIFADVFNFFLYDGRPVVDSDCLEELDTRELAVPYGGEKGEKQPVQRIRDVIRAVTSKTDSHKVYLLLAVENQSHVHYAMPIRNLLYDALQYTKQVERAAASHKLSGDYKGAGGDAYLSGFLREDRLIPVVTLVVYFGAEKWDGPLSIHEMFGPVDAELLPYIPDYRINLLAPASIEDGAFQKFGTSLREVLSFIKYSGDPDRLQALTSADENFRHLGRSEIDVLNACVNANLEIETEENREGVNVCKAIEEIAARAARKAMEQAAIEKEEAVRKAVKEASLEKEKAVKRQKIDTLFDSVRNLMESLSWSADHAMDALRISEGDRDLLTQRLQEVL